MDDCPNLDGVVTRGDGMRRRLPLLLAFFLLLPMSCVTVFGIAPAPDESHPYISTLSVTESDDMSWIDNPSIVSEHGRHMIHGSLTGSFNAGGEMISSANGIGVILEDVNDSWSNPIQLPFHPDVVVPSSHSSVFIHGAFDSSISIDQTTLTAEGPALYLASINHTSGLVWSHVIEDQGTNPELLKLIPTDAGGVVGIGQFSHERSLSNSYFFSPSGQNAGGITSASEIMAFHITPDGSLSWSETWGSDLDETLLSATSTDAGTAILIHHTSSFSGSTSPARNATFAQHVLPAEEGVVSFIIDSDTGSIDVAPWTMTNVTHLVTHPLGLIAVGVGNAGDIGCTDERSSSTQSGDESLTWFTALLDGNGQCLWSNHVIGYLSFELVDVAVSNNGRSFFQLNIGEQGQDGLPKTTTLNQITITHSKGRDTIVLTLELDGRWSSLLRIGHINVDDIGLGVMVTDAQSLSLHVDAQVSTSDIEYTGEQLLTIQLTPEPSSFDIVFQRDGTPLDSTTWSSGPVDVLITPHNHSGALTLTSNITGTTWTSEYVADGEQVIVTAEFPYGPQRICIQNSAVSPSCVDIIHESTPFVFNSAGSSTLFTSDDGGLVLTFSFVAVSPIQPQIDPGGIDGQVTYTTESTSLDRYLVNVSYLVYEGGESTFCVTATVEGHSPIERCQSASISSSLIDSDVDGVVDADDQCPDTPESERDIVSPGGCSTAQLTALEATSASGEEETTQSTSSPAAEIDSGSTPVLAILLVLIAAVAVIVVSSAPVIIQILKDRGEETSDQTDDS